MQREGCEVDPSTHDLTEELIRKPKACFLIVYYFFMLSFGIWSDLVKKKHGQ